MELCSEGSLPIAADIFTRAKSPGNSFAFLMTGVSTDYTEILRNPNIKRCHKINENRPISTLNNPTSNNNT